MKTKIIVILSILQGGMIAQAGINFSYEMKYGDGKQVLVTSPNNISPASENYNYIDNIMIKG